MKIQQTKTEHVTMKNREAPAKGKMLAAWQAQTSSLTRDDYRRIVLDMIG